MNTMLRNAHREVTKLRREHEKSEFATLDLVLVFDRSAEEMENLVGYKDFMQALQEIGGERTEENIQTACQASHLNRDSVLFGREQPEDKHIPIKCTQKQTKKMLYNSGSFDHLHFDLD